MITYKQLSLADIFTDCQNKLSRCLSFLILTLLPADLVNIFFIDAQGPVITAHFLYSKTSLLIVFLKYSCSFIFCKYSSVISAYPFTRLGIGVTG